MNRSNNVLNGSLLGSSGGKSKVFMAAAQWCVAQAAAVLTIGKRLRSAATPTVSAQTVLRAGRPLKASIDLSLHLVSEIRKATMKRLSASAEVVANFTATWRTYRLNRLAAHAIVRATTSANLRNIHPGFLASSAPLKVQTVAKLTRAARLKGSVSGTVIANWELKEASRQRAPVNRIILVPHSERTVFIKGSR